MKRGEAQKKMPITHQKIYRIMLTVTFVVSGGFFLKNVIGKDVQGMLVLGVCLAVFGGAALFMHVKNVNMHTKTMIVAMSLLFLVFLVSISSGESYSDDFPLFLAVVGMTGLYLEPKITIKQIVVAVVLLLFMYVINPQKGGAIGQYILCTVSFAVAASMFYQTIKRGRAFIEMSDERAKQAEGLLTSMKDMGEHLEEDFSKSSADIENNTRELKLGSVSIVQSAENMTNSCNDVQDRIHDSERSITELNEEVREFEEILTENQENMQTMSCQLASVTDTVSGANEVFLRMETLMGEVADIAEQLNNISFNTTILSLNASIEAARAGDAGAGFDVVATEMRELSNRSNGFSEQVSEVVKQMLSQVEETAGQFAESTKALEASRETMEELQASFSKLTERFDALYGNIEVQNTSVTQVNAIFADLKARILEMQQYSSDNQGAVESIVEAMGSYEVKIKQVIENTRQVDAE